MGVETPQERTNNINNLQDTLDNLQERIFALNDKDVQALLKSKGHSEEEIDKMRQDLQRIFEEKSQLAEQEKVKAKTA
jgi:hypothetical protein